MPHPTAHEPATGSCRCGALQMQITAPPFMTAACHCDGCRKMSSSAFSLTMMVMRDAFKVIAGAPVEAGRGDSGMLTHYACPQCHSWCYTDVAGMDFVNLRPALFDAPAWTEPFIETQRAEALPWVPELAPHAFDRFPDPAAFPELIAAFARARP